MSQQHSPASEPRTRPATLVLAGCLLLFALGGLAAVLLRWREPQPQRSDTDVPLGVEQAVVIRYGGPRLMARPYRHGASVNLRIADEVEKGGVRVYDVRYVVSLPGEFDLTEYLTSTDGRPIHDLPAFRVRGLTSLTKDIETRIQEIENVGVHIGHWYYESLAGLGVFWVVWLLGLIFVGRPRRPPRSAPPPRQPSIEEQIELLLSDIGRGELAVPERARLEALLLRNWRERLGLTSRRMADSCRDIEGSRELGPVYSKLQAWLHDSLAGVRPREFVEFYNQHRANDAGGVRRSLPES